MEQDDRITEFIPWTSYKFLLTDCIIPRTGQAPTCILASWETTKNTAVCQGESKAKQRRMDGGDKNSMPQRVNASLSEVSKDVTGHQFFSHNIQSTEKNPVYLMEL